jgi:death on curing protein
MKHLSKRFVLHMHKRLIELFGGHHGLHAEARYRASADKSPPKDMDMAMSLGALLESALAQPAASFNGQALHPDLADAAAAYAFHLARNHPFLDGNKRIAAVAMGTFLSINGHEVRFDEVELTHTILRVAEGQMDKTELANWLRARL